ncbi:hypothetical protein BGX34_005453 [Mortierella sp. NVP85]|nr:hypothetical protein BGX34_005453 [Mortierella sp. NVP85]
MSRNRFSGGMAWYRIPSKYGSSVSSSDRWSNLSASETEDLGPRRVPTDFTNASNLSVENKKI